MIINVNSDSLLLALSTFPFKGSLFVSIQLYELLCAVYFSPEGQVVKEYKKV